jgi:hypothetical protein
LTPLLTDLAIMQKTPFTPHLGPPQPDFLGRIRLSFESTTWVCRQFVGDPRPQSSRYTPPRGPTLTTSTQSSLWLKA